MFHRSSDMLGPLRVTNEVVIRVKEAGNVKTIRLLGVQYASNYGVTLFPSVKLESRDALLNTV